MCRFLRIIEKRECITKVREVASRGGFLGTCFPKRTHIVNGHVYVSLNKAKVVGI